MMGNLVLGVLYCVVLLADLGSSSIVLSSTTLRVNEHFTEEVIVDFTGALSDTNVTLINCSFSSTLAIQGNTTSTVLTVVRIDAPRNLSHLTVAPYTLAGAGSGGIIIERAHLTNITTAFGHHVLASSRAARLELRHCALRLLRNISADAAAFADFATNATNATLVVLNTTFSAVNLLPPPPVATPGPEVPATATPPPSDPQHYAAGYASAFEWFPRAFSHSNGSSVQFSLSTFDGLTAPLRQLGDSSNDLTFKATSVVVGRDVEVTYFMDGAFVSSTNLAASFKLCNLNSAFACRECGRSARNVTLELVNTVIDGAFAFNSSFTSLSGTSNTVLFSDNAVVKATKSFRNFLADMSRESLVTVTGVIKNTGRGAFDNFLARASAFAGTVQIENSGPASFQGCFRGAVDVSATLIVYDSVGDASFDDCVVDAVNTTLEMRGSVSQGSFSRFAARSERVNTTVSMELVEGAFANCFVNATASSSLSIANTKVAGSQTFMSCFALSRNSSVHVDECNFGAGIDALAYVGSDSSNFTMTVTRTHVSGKRAFAHAARLSRFALLNFSNISFLLASNDSVAQACESSERCTLIIDRVQFNGLHTFKGALSDSSTSTLGVSNSDFYRESRRDFAGTALNATNIAITVSTISLLGTSSFEDALVGCVLCNATFRASTCRGGSDNFRHLAESTTSTSVVVVDLVQHAGERAFWRAFAKSKTGRFTIDGVENFNSTRDSFAGIATGASGARVVLRNARLYDHDAFGSLLATCVDSCSAEVSNIVVHAHSNGTLSHCGRAASGANITLTSLTTSGHGTLASVGEACVDCTISLNNLEILSPLPVRAVLDFAGDALLNARRTRLYVSNVTSTSSLTRVLLAALTNSSHCNVSASRVSVEGGSLLSRCCENSTSVMIALVGFVGGTAFDSAFTDSLNASLAVAAVERSTLLCCGAFRSSRFAAVDLSNITAVSSSLGSAFLAASGSFIRLQGAVLEGSIGVASFESAQDCNFHISNCTFIMSPNNLSLARVFAGSSRCLLRVDGESRNISMPFAFANSYNGRLEVQPKSHIADCSFAFHASEHGSANFVESAVAACASFGANSRSLRSSWIGTTVTAAATGMMDNAVDGSCEFRDTTVISTQSFVAQSFTSVERVHLLITNCSFIGCHGAFSQSLRNSSSSRLVLTSVTSDWSSSVFEDIGFQARGLDVEVRRSGRFGANSLAFLGRQCHRCNVNISFVADFAGQAAAWILANSTRSRLMVVNVTNASGAAFSEAMVGADGGLAFFADLTALRDSSFFGIGLFASDLDVCFRIATVEHSRPPAELRASLLRNARDSALLCATRTPTPTASASPTKTASLSLGTGSSTASASMSRSRSTSTELTSSRMVTLSSSTNATQTDELTLTETCVTGSITAISPAREGVLRFVDGVVNLTVSVTPVGALLEPVASVSWGRLVDVSLDSTRSRLYVALTAPPNAPLRADIVVDVTMPRTSFACQPDSDPQVSFVVVGLPSVIDVKVKKSIQVAATATGAIAGVLANPTLALTQNRLGALFMLSSCRFDHSDEVADNPTGWRFGSSEGQYYRGSVVGGWAILFGSVAGLAALGTFIHLFVKKKRRRKSLWRTLSFVHFPGVCIVCFAVVAQGTTMSATAVMIHGVDRGDMLLGTAALCTNIGIVIACTALMTRWFDATAVERKRLATTGYTHSLKSLLLRTTVVFDTQWKWLDTGSGFRRRFMHLFNDFRPARQYFLTVELCASLALGILEGVRPGTPFGCSATLLAMTVTCILLLVAILALRPYAAPFNGAISVFVNGCAAASAVCLFTAQVQSSESPVAVGEAIALAAMVAGMVKAAVDALNFVLWAATRSDRLLHSFNVTFGTANSKSLTAADLDAIMLLDVPVNDDGDAADSLLESHQSGGGDAAADGDGGEGDAVPLALSPSLSNSEDSAEPERASLDDADDDVFELFITEQRRMAREIEAGLTHGAPPDGDS